MPLRPSTVRFFALLSCAGVLGAQAEPPRTVPEATAHAETSRLADVERFVAACRGLPHGDQLTTRIAGKSHEGRPLLLVRAAATAAPAQPRLRALLIANIHAGECEGKEALQMLLREFALGQHHDVLARCEVWLLPIYNVDGNEAVGPKNREGQNGPDVVGRRANGQGLDLNRDFVKAEAPETQALLGLFTELDPHLFMDLHTTNGSAHGYQLTYAPGLSPNSDPEIKALSRALLDDVTATLQKDHGLRTFDYGNFETRDWDGGGAPESGPVRGWYSYDHRARYGVNCFGLRNRIAILSEAYSYADFATRIAATRAFVLATLQWLCAAETEVFAVSARADARPASAVPPAFGFDTTFAAPETLPVLVGKTKRIEGTDGAPMRQVVDGEPVAEPMPVVRAFTARKSLPLPEAWALPAPLPAVVHLLQRHGIAATTTDAARTVTAQRFAVTAKKKPKRPFQGHQELVLAGTWQDAAAVELPAGTLLVSARQRLAVLAATLLEPESEDSLSTWNFLEAATADHYPVLRVVRQ
ncbi:MAG: M14 family metallopeptidase [Planctomycetota bacterium]